MVNINLKKKRWSVCVTQTRIWVHRKHLDGSKRINNRSEKVKRVCGWLQQFCEGSRTDCSDKLCSRERCTWDVNSSKPTLELSWLETDTRIPSLKWIPGQRWLSTDKRFENERPHISQCYYHRSENQLGSERLTLTSSVSQHPLQHQSNHSNTMSIH